MHRLRKSIVLLMLAAPLGCYHHVVSAEGVGSDDVTTYEPHDKQESKPDEFQQPEGYE